MKKVLFILLAVVIVLAGSVLRVLRGMGVSDAALLCRPRRSRWRPARSASVLFALAPDHSGKIGVEPQLKAFLEQPFKYLTKQQGATRPRGFSSA